MSKPPQWPQLLERLVDAERERLAELYRSIYGQHGNPDEAADAQLRVEVAAFLQLEAVLPRLLKAPELWRVVNDMTLAIEGEGEFTTWDDSWQQVYKRAKQLLAKQEEG
jgi:hypothetical protein